MDVDYRVSDSDFSSVTIKCSWSEVKNQVKDALSFVDFTRKETEEEDACSTIVPESCVFLCQPNGSEEPPTIDIIANNSSHIFKKIHVISEANFIEVYGLFGEYIKTVIGELIEDVDGTLAFSCLIEDISLSHLFTLKFVGLKGAKEMWLFGGRVWSLKDSSTAGSPGGRLNMERIDIRLSEGNCQLSPSADSLKRLVSEYVTRNSAQGCLENIARDYARSRREVDSLNNRSYSFDHPSSAPTSPPPIDFWKTYIDSSLKNMENRIMDNVTEQIRELELRQNKRLDHILKLLENSIPAASNNNP